MATASSEELIFFWKRDLSASCLLIQSEKPLVEKQKGDFKVLL